MSSHTGLINAMQQVVGILPSSVLHQLVDSLREIKNINHLTSRSHIITPFVSPEARNLIGHLLDVWATDYPHLGGDVVSLALESAGAAIEYNRKMRSIEIVWTGPVVHEVNLRRTENVLLELIQSARSHLHIVSFAVYRATQISDALVHALDRGVSVSIYLETHTSEQSENKFKYDVKKALGVTLAQEANIYTWSASKRQVSPTNKHGVLHAKTAIADSESCFITSANLTDHAMSLNIELGVLIRDQETALKIEHQLRLLIEKNIFVLI